MTYNLTYERGFEDGKDAADATLKARLAEIERLRRENADVECHNAELGSRIEYLRGILVRIDNCDAIEINVDCNQEAIAIAKVIWDDIHAALATKDTSNV